MNIRQTLGFLFLIIKGYNAKSPNVEQTLNFQSPLFKDMLNDLRQVYDNKLNNMQKRLTLQEESNKELRRQYSNLAGILQGLSRERRLLDRPLFQTTTPTPAKPKIAFYAQLTQDKTALGDYQPIEFDLVTTNIGNAYNKADGMFTAPVPGTYVFSWTAANHDRTSMWSQLVVNGKMFGKTLSDSADHNDIAVASNMVVVSLQASDVVWIRSMTAHTHTLMGSQLSSFSGFLLYSD